MGIFDRFKKKQDNTGSYSTSADRVELAQPAPRREGATARGRDQIIREEVWEEPQASGSTRRHKLRALKPEETAELEDHIEELTGLGLLDSDTALDLWFTRHKLAYENNPSGVNVRDVVTKAGYAAAYIVRRSSYYDFAMFGDELVLASSAEGIALPGLRPITTMRSILAAPDALPSTWIRGARYISENFGAPEQESFISGANIASTPTQRESDYLGVGLVEARDAGFDCSTSIDEAVNRIHSTSDADSFIRMLSGHIFGRLRKEYSAKYIMASSMLGREYTTIIESEAGQISVAPKIIATSMFAERDTMSVSERVRKFFDGIRTFVNQGPTPQQLASEPETIYPAQDN